MTSHYYEITQAIKDQLKEDIFVNTVTIGDIFKVDLNKLTIFPLSHIMINSATYQGPTWIYNVSILCMDVVDESKELTTDIFLGNDNEQDVLNTQLMVANRFLEVLRRGNMSENYELSGTPTVEFFVERFENKLAGITLTFDIVIQNEMTKC
jgi:alpha-amylase/alpha-mannosidase (GH57 family)